LQNDFHKIDTYKKVLYLPNGVENNFTEEKEFKTYIEKKDFKNIHILYLSNMIKSKGYYEVLKLAKLYNSSNYIFHFAGGWQNSQDEIEFFDFLKENNLEQKVIFHGFVNGTQKKELFKKSHIFIFPTRYENEAFPLSILEAFSYGLPVLSTDEGSIPYIIDRKSGIVINDINDLEKGFKNILDNYINITTAKYCRKRYLENFSLEQFEKNLIRIFE